MMVLVVIVYTVCWLPLNIVQIIADWFPNLQQLKWFPVLYFLVHWLAMSHPCYNPVIYCWMNGRFRVSFYGVFRKVPILKHTVKKYDKSNLMSQAVLSDHMSCRHNIRSIRCNTKRAEGDLDELECHRFISSKSARSSHLLSVEHGL
ncbi:hypothetical protein M8J77_023367 [Diaphorina citri]|nr:hypothetical protein M8J77_023367 [Diaphorina citri]